jgi:hypothetical protein
MPAVIHRVHTDSHGCSGQQAVTGPAGTVTRAVGQYSLL